MNDEGRGIFRASSRYCRLTLVLLNACAKSTEDTRETRPDPWASKADATLVEPASAEKNSGDASGSASPTASASATSSPSETASASAAPTSPAVPSGTSATKAGGATATVAPSSRDAPVPAPRSEPAASAKTAAGDTRIPASARTVGRNFVLDLASAGCRAGEACAVTLRLQPQGDYHVNKEYPYKFIATPAAGITWLGSADPNTFTRAAGDFREDGEKSATMTVKFRPAARGEATVSGTYKLSVCSAENCQIEQQAVTFKVPVS